MNFIAASPGPVLRTNSQKVADGIVNLVDIVSQSCHCFNVFSQKLRSEKKRSEIKKLSKAFIKATEKLNQDLSKPKTLSERIFFNCAKNFHSLVKPILKQILQIVPMDKNYVISGEILKDAAQRLSVLFINTLPCLLNDIGKNLKPKPPHIYGLE